MAQTVSDEYQRWRLTERLRRRLLAQESPRLQMTLVVALSGAAGFLSSVALLHLGLRRIPVRYVGAVAIAYGVFLALLYAWIVLRRRGGQARESGSAGSSSGDSDLLGGIDVSGGSSGGSGSGSVFSGGGGRFGGGGASESWTADTAGSVGKATAAGGHGFDLSFDGDDTGIVIVIGIAALVLFGTAIWVVSMAPSLFAELLLDGGLSAALYRRLGRIPHPWLDTALKKTVLPFLVTAVTLGVAGMIFESYAPEAHSLGGVIAHLARPK